MKFRMGYVSNSSSSSFVIVGFQVTGNDEDMLYKLGFENEDGYFGLGHGRQEKDGLVLVGNGYPEYVGVSIEKMSDNETLADYKKRLVALCREKGVNKQYQLSLLFGEAGTG